jgi:hypothetical protein
MGGGDQCPVIEIHALVSSITTVHYCHNKNRTFNNWYVCEFMMMMKLSAPNDHLLAIADQLSSSTTMIKMQSGKLKRKKVQYDMYV